MGGLVPGMMGIRDPSEPYSAWVARKNREQVDALRQNELDATAAETRNFAEQREFDRETTTPEEWAARYEPGGPPMSEIAQTPIPKLAGAPGAVKSATPSLSDAQAEGLGGEPLPPIPDVRSGASSNAPEYRVSSSTPAPAGSIRFQLPGGEWKEYDSGGASRESRLGLTPETGPPMPDDEGPAMSVLPRVTDYIPDSVLEDRGRAAELRRSEAFASDPFADRTAGIGAALAEYQGKKGIDLQSQLGEEKRFAEKIAPFTKTLEEVDREMASIRQMPEFQALPPQQKEARLALLQDKRLNAEASIKREQQMRDLLSGRSHINNLWRPDAGLGG